MNPANLAAFVVSLVVGLGVLYANPKRHINRAFFLLSVNVSAWVLSLAWLTAEPVIPNPVLWIRIASAIAAFIPLLLWVIKDCAKGADLGWSSLKAGWPWVVVAFCMVALCFSRYFIPFESTREHPMRGFGWTLYALVNAGSYVVLLAEAVSSVQSFSGLQKIEIQTLLFGGTASGFTGVAMMVLGTVFNIPALSRSIPMVIVVFYSFTAWAITTQKIFDARHLFRSGIQLAVSIGAVAFIIGLANKVPPTQVPRTLVIILCASLITLVFNQFNRHVLKATLMGGDKEGQGVRAAILATGREEFDREVLIRRFGTILEHWSRVDHAHFLILSKEQYSNGNVSLPYSYPGTKELLAGTWATPESLLRQREGGGRRELAEFLKENHLSVMVCAPSDEGRPPFILALEVRRDRSPFTWSDIKLLQEWTTIIENTLSRISLTQQARESEQLLTAGLLGASLAHEIRNPLVTLKTIAQSAATRYSDPEFRRLLIELVPAEIERIEGLVSGLMDLGRPQYPHFESISLNEVVETSVKLVRPKALDESVSLTCVLGADPDVINADRASVRQVILNLVMNAIQAVAENDGRREVRVHTLNGETTLVLEVSDNGPGMPEDMRERLFQPFTTSNKTSGMGLGLAITADLVKLHHGQIILVEGNDVGTTFRVTLPCQQPSY